jgi:tetratricopeptide (TPR) repeat protein
MKSRRLKTLSVLFFLLLLAPVRSEAATNQVLIDSAKQAYAHKEFKKAITFYEQVLAADQESPVVYYNLGNAYYKSNNMPKAILNYERAKRLLPEEEDVDFNLRMANQQITDKVEDTEIHYLEKWEARILNLFSEEGWCIGCFIAFSICLGFVVLYICSSRIWLRQLSFGLATLGILVAVSAFILARGKYYAGITHETAIIMTPNITTKGSPDEKGTDLFILHEGTKVQLLQSSGGWREIKLSNGHTGWLPLSAFEII